MNNIAEAYDLVINTIYTRLELIIRNIPQSELTEYQQSELIRLVDALGKYNFNNLPSWIADAIQ